MERLPSVGEAAVDGKCQTGSRNLGRVELRSPPLVPLSSSRPFVSRAKARLPGGVEVRGPDLHAGGEAEASCPGSISPGRGDQEE